MFPEATHRKPLPRGASSLSSVVTEVGTANAPGDVPYLKRETLVTMFGRLGHWQVELEARPTDTSRGGRFRVHTRPSQARVTPGGSGDGVHL